MQKMAEGFLYQALSWMLSNTDPYTDVHVRKPNQIGTTFVNKYAFHKISNGHQ